MNARKFLNVRVGLTVTALALSGALAFSAGSCAGSGDGGSGGNTNPSTGGTSGGNGGSAGGGAGSGGGNCSGDGVVCFSNGQAQGAMTGYGWVAMGSLDKLSDPTCDTDKHEITNANACTTTTNWTGANGLCITGSIPALPPTPAQTDYDNNWGVQIGVNSSEPAGTTLGKSYASVTFTVTGTPSSGLRAELHRKGDAAGTTYCANMTSGTAITLTSFNTKCWDGSGDSLTAADVSNIDKAGVQVSSAATAITVTNLCLTGISFK